MDRTTDFGSVGEGSNPSAATNCISNQSITIMHPLKYPQIVLRVLFFIEKMNTTFVNKIVCEQFITECCK